MICKNCGTNIQNDSEFCSVCGAKTAVGEAKKTPTTVVKPRKRKWIIIGIVVLTVIVAVLLVLALTGLFPKVYRLSDETKATLNDPALAVMIENYLNDYEALVDKAALKGTTTGTTHSIELFVDYYEKYGDYMDRDKKRICATAVLIYYMGEYSWYQGVEHSEYIQGYRNRLNEFNDKYCS